MSSGSFGSIGTATVDVKADLGTLDADLGKIPAKVAQMSSQVDAGMARVGHSTRNVGHAALEASRAIEDLQYGLAGVINNVPGLVMALGGTAGLTAVISLTAVAINQLVKHWDEISAHWKSDATIKEAERMQKLAEHTKKVADETERLNKLKGVETERRISDVEAGIKQVGMPQATADMSLAIRRSGVGGTPEMDRANAEKLLARAMTGEEAALREVENLLNFVGHSMLGNAITDPGGKKAAANAAAANAEREKIAAAKVKVAQDAAKEEEEAGVRDLYDSLEEAEKGKKLEEAKLQENWDEMKAKAKALPKEAAQVQMQSLDSYLSQIATAGQNAGKDKVPDLIGESNKKLAEIAANTAKQQQPKWGKGNFLR